MSARESAIPSTPVRVDASNEPLNVLLMRVLKRVGINAWVSPALNTPININVKADSARAFVWRFVQDRKLPTYWDGSRLYIYAPSEATATTVDAAAPTTVAKELQALVGNASSVAPTRRGVRVVGPPPLVAEARKIAARTAPAPAVKAARAVREADAEPVVVAQPAKLNGRAASGVIISPQLVPPSQQALFDGIAGTGAMTAGLQPVETIEGIVQHVATPANPLETRIFKLKNAWAADRVTGDRGQVVRGVASKVAESMGIQYQSSVVSQSQARVVAGSDDERSINIYTGPQQPVVETRRDVMDMSPTIMADEGNNWVVVRARPAQMSAITAAINTYDQVAPQISLTITTVEIFHDSLRKRGVNLADSLDNLALLIGGAVTGGGGALVGGIIAAPNREIIGGLRDLNGRGAGRAVSARQAILTPGETHRITDVDQYDVARGGERGGLETLSAGFKMDVTSSLRGDERTGRRIALDLSIEDSRFTGAALKSIPARSSSTVNLTPVIQQGESLVIASTRKTVDINKTDSNRIFGDIPVLKLLFRTKTLGRMEVQRLTIVTPRVIAPRSTLPERRKTLEELSDRAGAPAALVAATVGG